MMKVVYWLYTSSIRAFENTECQYAATIGSMYYLAFLDVPYLLELKLLLLDSLAVND